MSNRDTPLHDLEMPARWHTIKSVLLKEICSAANFHHIAEAAEALFHARVIGESIVREREKAEMGR